MNQIQTGKFIAALRKAKGLTQLQLADILGISDKTVSKWERGAGMPDVSLMLPLCDTLEISVNELLTGEKLTDTNYKINAEANMMELVRENKKRLLQSVVCGMITIIAVCSLIIIAAFLPLPNVVRILIILFALAVAAVGVGTSATLDINAGRFECPYCKKLFVPSMGEYVRGYHTFTKRRLTCPKCGKTGMCWHIIGK